jgi:hypothetical protein
VTARHERFADFDWAAVVAGLVGRLPGSATLLARRDCEVEVLVPGVGRLLLTDNGGEVNVSAIVDLLGFSVPYTDTRKDVGELTLASRLNQAILGEPINYDVDLDGEEVA